MKTERLQKSLIFILILTMLTVLTVGVAYASLSSTITINQKYEAGTEHFVIDGGVYNKSFTVTAGQASTSLTINRIDYTEQSVTAFDLVVFMPSGGVTANGNSGTVKAVSDGAATVFSNVAIADAQSANVTLTYTDAPAGEVKVVVLTHSNANRYISDLFELKMLQNEALHNTYLDATMPAGSLASYKNVYLLDDITIDADFVLNFPCYINLLYSDLILAAPMEIRHHEKGAYEISAVTGQIQNDDYIFTINCPRAYYRTIGEISALVSSQTNLVKFGDLVDFSSAENAALLTSLLDDSIAYATACIPSQLFGDVIFPFAYQDYGVTYSYSTNNTAVLDALGQVTRNVANTDVTVTVTATYDTHTVTGTKTVQVVGTSDSAFVSALGSAMDAYAAEIGTPIGNPIAYYLTQPADIAELLRDFLLYSEHTNAFSLRVDNAVNLDFKYENVRYQILNFTYDANDGYSVSFDGGAATLLAGKEIFLVPQEWMVTGGTEDLTITDGTNSVQSTFLLRGISQAQQTAYLEQFIETLFFEEPTSADVMRIETALNSIYKGDLVNGTELIPYTFGFSDIDYNIYLVDVTDLTDLKNNVLPATAIPSLGPLYNSYFLIEEGVISPDAEQLLTFEDTKALVLAISFIYPDNSTYETFREIIIPADGIGGSEYLEYISGNTFGYYFDALDDGKLINSTADSAVGVLDGTANRFRSEITGVSMSMSLNTSGIESFCNLIKHGNYYQIDIDIESIPAENTPVNLTAIFYFDNNSDGNYGIDDTEISTQAYSFIIPGIYKCDGTDFASTYVYQRIITLQDENDNFVYESYSGYLLVDGARAEVEVFDCSLPNLVGATTSTYIDLKGINYLTNTASMIFDGCNLKNTAVEATSLSAFGEFTTYNLLSLSLDGCGITDAMLQAGDLTNLHRLQTINLDNNRISSLQTPTGEAVLYRTLTSLSLNSQAALSSLKGLSLLPNLTVLYVQDNKIEDFTPVTDLDKLNAVHLDGNDVDASTEFTVKSVGDTNNYYGTNGKINVPVYVTLIDKGVSVYADTTGTPIGIGDGEFISLKEYYASLILNAVYIFEKQSTSVDFPASVTEYTNVVGAVTPGTTYTLDAVYFVVDNVVKAANVTNSTGLIDCSSFLSVNDEVRLIAKVTYNSVAVYKQFSFLYI